MNRVIINVSARWRSEVITLFQNRKNQKQTCSLLDKAQTRCVSPQKNKENEFHRHFPIEQRNFPFKAYDFLKSIFNNHFVFRSTRNSFIELKKSLRVYSPAQYLQVLWQYLASIVVILTSIDPILGKCVHLQVQFSWVLTQYL